MSALPIVTVGAANAATTIPSGVSKAWNDSAFRFFGANVAVRGGGFPENTLGAPNSLTNPPASNAQPFFCDVMFDGSVFEFRTKGVAGFYWLTVDDQHVTPLPVAGPGATGSIYLIRVDFGSRAPRRITIAMAAGQPFGGLYVGPTDTLWTPTYSRSKRAIVLGDSFTEGTGAAASVSSFVFTLGRLMGWGDTWASGSGGTGYLNPGSGGRVKFRDRVQNDVLQWSPNIIVVAGGLNDHSTSTQAQIQAEATALFTQMRAALPKVLLYVLGPWWPGGGPPADISTTRDAIKTAALAQAAIDGKTWFIDNIANGWMTGTGKVTAPVGDGNADWYTSSDGTHPSQAGHDYLAPRIAAGISGTFS